MVFGNTTNERLQLNDDSMWPGDLGWDQPDGDREDLEHIRELLFKGKNSEADQLMIEEFSRLGVIRSHQTLGELFFNFDHQNITEYSDPDKIKYMISEYYGIITEIDDWVGEILDKLDTLGIADQTLVIFTSDHGEMLGAHGMREKNIFYEESAHIPLLIRFPGEVQPATTVEGYVSLVDLFPTILDYLA